MIDDRKIVETIKDYKSKFYDIEVCIGTDSQNTNHTKVVTVVAIRNIGHGGVFFYDIEYIDRMDVLSNKIHYETNKSIEMAQRFQKVFEENNIDNEIIIHADIGEYGKTKSLISEITGWIKGMGFDCCIKPDSWASSSIADMISK